MKINELLFTILVIKFLLINIPRIFLSSRHKLISNYNQEVSMPKSKSKSELNTSYTDLPDTKTNASTAKTAVHK